MQSRCVLVDKNEGKSTAENPLDTKASARIGVPGYADPDVLGIRKDSPTACREAINVLLAISASKGRDKWALLTADLQAAFLNGEFQDKDRVLYCWPPKNGPALPGVQSGSLLPILKGVFGLNDAPRKWCEKIPKVLVEIGFRKQGVCLGLSTLQSPAGILSGVICLHVDDMLGIGDELFDSKLNELDKLVRFGSMKRQKFDHCGRQHEKHAYGEITISMKAYIQNLRKADRTLERTKQLDDELSASESHEFRGINGCLQWATKELLYPFQFVVKVLQRRQGKARVRDLLKANEVIDEIKQHEDFTLTLRVLDLTSCGLIEVSDASLGGVDRFGYPTDQDSKTVKIHSQAGVGIFIGEKRLVSLGARGKFNVLGCDSRTITRVCRPSMAAETRGLGLQVDTMQFYADWLNEILGESAPSSKNLHLKQNAIEWPKMIVTDARDVYDKLSTEKGRLPQQKALTLDIATFREWLVNSSALIRWSADENMIMNGLTQDHKESRQHWTRVLQNGEWSVQRDDTLVREKLASQSKRTRSTKPEQTSTNVHSEELHDESCIVENWTTSRRLNRSESLNRTSMCQCPRFWKRSSTLRQLSTFPSCTSNSSLLLIVVFFFLLWYGALHTVFF